MFPVPQWLQSFDGLVLWCLLPLAIAILISGLDDLVVDVVWVFDYIGHRLRPSTHKPLEGAVERSIAILVPLWHEHEVIGRMLEHNLASVQYANYSIFAGTYLNDPQTQAAVQAVAERFPQVHLTVCPHGGPTSKADCLNWIYQSLSLYEETHGRSFELVVVHDAEDLIHPEELRWFNHYAADYDFIQTPVLALQTPLWDFTHGIYCDEFAEYHTRDMTVRALFGAFLPSCGVGTAYRREALEKLAQHDANRLFEPSALTEDYESGLRLFRLGCRQAFIPITRLQKHERDFLATREFFPGTWKPALRQRTRWVMGIALQGWQRHGWTGTPGEVYWLWRDRKGLIGGPLSVLANFVFVYGLASGLWSRLPWLTARITFATLALQAIRSLVRMVCVARIYGTVFACGVPLRAIYANVLNSASVLQALVLYAMAHARGNAIPWLKTEHSYPSRAALLLYKRRLGEILVGSGYLTLKALEEALASQPPEVRLGEHLVNAGFLKEEIVYEALSLQQGLPFQRVGLPDVMRGVTRTLPATVARQWKVLPFRIMEGSLVVAGPNLPSIQMDHALRPFTSLDIRFQLMTPTDYETLAEVLL